MDAKAAELTIRLGFEDKHGLIVQANGDGGDCCSRTGLFWYAIFIFRGGARPDRDEFMADFRQLRVSIPGNLRRHPDQGPNCGKPGARDFSCWNNPRVFSRDQLIPILIALGAWDRKVELTEILKAHLKRFFFCQNGDLTGPQHFGVWIRAFENKFFKPILYVTDLFLVLGALIDLVKFKFNPGDTSDVIIGALQIIQGKRVLPTFLTHLAAWILNFRGVQDAWNIYFHHKTGAPPFNDLYRPLIKDYF